MSDITAAIRVLTNSIKNLRYIQPQRSLDYELAVQAIDILKMRLELDDDGDYENENNM
jgi:hypothetical protein